MIEAQNLTLTYSSGKGVFNLTFRVSEGEAMGYLGPNGAGKTTTIRQLMGFMRPDSGTCTIDGLSCFENAPRIMQRLGYIPGEIAFLEGMTGEEYLQYLCEVRGIKDLHHQKELLERFEFSPKGSIKKFSKGMKQKLGIVAAFQHDPAVLILDEPTSGLDPLMQSRFVELLAQERSRGKTILLSSHMFDEVERTCHNVLIIKDGRIVAQSDIAGLKMSQRKGFVVKTPQLSRALQVFAALGFETRPLHDAIEVYVTGANTDAFAKALSQFSVSALDCQTQTLEDVFMQFYAKEEA